MKAISAKNKIIIIVLAGLALFLIISGTIYFSFSETKPLAAEKAYFVKLETLMAKTRQQVKAYTKEPNTNNIRFFFRAYTEIKAILSKPEIQLSGENKKAITEIKSLIPSYQIAFVKLVRQPALKGQGKRPRLELSFKIYGKRLENLAKLTGNGKLVGNISAIRQDESTIIQNLKSAEVKKFTQKLMELKSELNGSGLSEMEIEFVSEAIKEYQDALETLNDLPKEFSLNDSNQAVIEIQSVENKLAERAGIGLQNIIAKQKKVILGYSAGGVFLSLLLCTGIFFVLRKAAPKD